MLALDFSRLKVLTTHLWHRFMCHTWTGTCIQGTCIHMNTHILWPCLTYADRRHPFDTISPMFIFDLLTMAVARLILMEWTSSKTGWSCYSQIKPRVKMPDHTDRNVLTLTWFLSACGIKQDIFTQTSSSPSFTNTGQVFSGVFDRRTKYPVLLFEWLQTLQKTIP